MNDASTVLGACLERASSIGDSELFEQAESAWNGTVGAATHIGVSRATWQRWKAHPEMMPTLARRSIVAHLLVHWLTRTEAAPESP